MGREGLFAAEPDFPLALAEYRRAVEHAGARAEPPFDPPDDFLPGLADLPHLRRLNWRTESRFPEVCAGWAWLAEMLDRVVGGTPPLSEAEFAGLADWFHRNEERLCRLARPPELLDLGSGRKESCANLRHQIQRGARAAGAGKLAEDLRGLRRRYGGAGP